MISVASYNIRKSVGTDWRRDPGRILDIISEIGADIIALQEVDRRFGSRAASLSPEMVADRTDYFAISFGVREQSLGWHGNTILYRQGIEVLDTKTLTLPALEPRGAVLGDFQVGKERLRVIGLHLGLVDLWRRRQAQSVLNQLDILDETLPTVIMVISIMDDGRWVPRPFCRKSSGGRAGSELSFVTPCAQFRPHHHDDGHRCGRFGCSHV